MNGSRMNADQHLAILDHWLVDVLELQDLDGEPYLSWTIADISVETDVCGVGPEWDSVVGFVSIMGFYSLCGGLEGDLPCRTILGERLRDRHRGQHWLTT